MRCQDLARFFDGFSEAAAEFVVLKMSAHLIHKTLPRLFAAFFVNCFVADNRKFMRAWRDEDQHGVAVARFLHAELLKFPLRSCQRIDIQFPALNVDANFPGCL